MNQNLFISYSRVDSEFVVRLVRDLRTLHVEVWFDQIDIPPGANWDDEIERALDQAKIVIVVLSEASGRSENVRNEIGHALDHGKQVLPVLLSRGTVPLRITRLQREDFSGDYPTALAKLTRRLMGETKTASLQAISSEDVRREATKAAQRLSAGRLPGVPLDVGDDTQTRPSESELLGSLASATIHPTPRAGWTRQRVIPLALGVAALAGAGIAVLRSSADSRQSPEKTTAVALTAAPSAAAVATAQSRPEPTLSPTALESTKEHEKAAPSATEYPTDVTPAPTGPSASVCSQLNYGDCKSITRSADLRTPPIGSDRVFSIQRGDCRIVTVCANVNFGEPCATLSGDIADLARTKIGSRRALSIECVGDRRPAARLKATP